MSGTVHCKTGNSGLYPLHVFHVSAWNYYYDVVVSSACSILLSSVFVSFGLLQYLNRFWPNILPSSDSLTVNAVFDHHPKSL